MFTSRKIGIYSSVCLKIVVILKSQHFILVKFKESHHGSILEEQRKLLRFLGRFVVWTSLWDLHEHPKIPKTLDLLPCQFGWVKTIESFESIRSNFPWFNLKAIHISRILWGLEGHNGWEKYWTTRPKWWLPANLSEYQNRKEIQITTQSIHLASGTYLPR